MTNPGTNAVLAAAAALLFASTGCAVETAEHAALSGNAAIAQEPFDGKAGDWARTSARAQTTHPGDLPAEDEASKVGLSAYGSPAGTRSSLRSVTLDGSEGEIGGRVQEEATRRPSTKSPLP